MNNIWIGRIKKYLIENYYGLTPDQIEDAAMDITYRCFAITGTPTAEELPQYIINYMNR